MGTREPNPIDQVVGTNIRLWRLVRGLSQEKLAEQLGVSFQQVQKYEKGVNRVGASRLMRAASVLDLPISALFAGAEITEAGEPCETVRPDLQIREPTTFKLVQAFSEIPDLAVRRSVIVMVEKIASTFSRAK